MCKVVVSHGVTYALLDLEVCVRTRVVQRLDIFSSHADREGPKFPCDGKESWFRSHKVVDDSPTRRWPTVIDCKAILHFNIS
jgi:hypothetical protein